MSNVTASILANAIPARLSHFEGRDRLTIGLSEGVEAYAEVSKLAKKVLICNGKNFVFIGWNSDRNECFFIEDNTAIAIVHKRKL